MAKATTPAPASSPFDPATMVVTDRPTLKRKSNLVHSGQDREPFYALIKTLQVGQVVEIPGILEDKDARAVANLLRESAKDLGLALTFLADTARNSDGGVDATAGKSFYAWFVKGPFVARGPRQGK